MLRLHPRAELRLQLFQDARQLGEVDRVDVGPCLRGADAEAVGVAPQHQQRMVAGIVLRLANRPFDEPGEGEAGYGQCPLVRRNILAGGAVLANTLTRRRVPGAVKLDEDIQARVLGDPLHLLDVLPGLLRERHVAFDAVRTHEHHDRPFRPPLVGVAVVRIRARARFVGHGFLLRRAGKRAHPCSVPPAVTRRGDRTPSVGRDARTTAATPDLTHEPDILNTWGGRIGKTPGRC